MFLLGFLREAQDKVATSNTGGCKINIVSLNLHTFTDYSVKIKTNKNSSYKMLKASLSNTSR